MIQLAAFIYKKEWRNFRSIDDMFHVKQKRVKITYNNVKTKRL